MNDMDNGWGLGDAGLDWLSSSSLPGGREGAGSETSHDIGATFISEALDAVSLFRPDRPR